MQSIKIFNTLSGKKEEFNPLDPNHIKIYACGPTVYNYAHIGNARMAVVFDTLVRVLRYKYPKVTYVSNITDIDDKIIDAANEQQVPIKEITEKYTNIKLTDSFAMTPASSVSGLYFSHPDSRYFGISRINEDQLIDYADRKKMEKERLIKIFPQVIDL